MDSVVAGAPWGLEPLEDFNLFVSRSFLSSSSFPHSIVSDPLEDADASLFLLSAT